MRTWIVGTDQTCDIRVVDEYVSNRHCEIMVDDHGRVWVEDLGSTNGTWINGKVRIYTRQRINPGTAVRIGRTDVPLEDVFAAAKEARHAADNAQVREQLRKSNPEFTDEQLDNLVGFLDTIQREFDGELNVTLKYLADTLEAAIDKDLSRMTEPGLRYAVKVIRATMDELPR
jgi:predicted component of type VI protein secretion system